MKNSNTDYRQTSHFSDNGFHIKIDDIPSVDHEAPINTTIQENPYKSNVNIEKNELVLKPDLSAIFKAKGKKHYDGGMNVYLEPDSFVFSDDKSLALNKADHKLFELKEGGNFNKKQNTPAKVVARNIDIEHYNRVINNLNDKKQDTVTKNSSMLMAEKYMKTLGQVAYIQEEKKGLPQGTPAFSDNTAPVYDTDTKNEIMETKQYAKYGGHIEGSLPKAQWGRITPQDNSSSRSWGMGPSTTAASPSNGYGITSYRGDRNWKGNASQYSDQQWNDFAKKLGFTGHGNKQFQEFLFNNPDIQDKIIGLHKQYGDPNGGEWFDARLGHRWDALLESFNVNKDEVRDPNSYDYTQYEHTPAPQPGTTSTDHLDQNPPTGPLDKGRMANWQFTPHQKADQLYDLYKLASVKKYGPYRSHFNASYAEPSLLNPEQAVGDMQSSANTQISSLNTLNPILRNAQASSAYGEFLNRVPQVRSQYDNQNAGITNQFRQYNNQTKNNETYTNMGNDRQYKIEETTGNVNYDRMKSYLGDQFMGHRDTQVEQNQALAYDLLTLNNPRYGYDFKTGNFYSNPKDIRDARSDAKGDIYQTVLTALASKVPNMTIDQMLQFSKQKGFSDLLKNYQPNPFEKKGGTIKKSYSNYNPYR